jgi:hypothetical protein
LLEHFIARDWLRREAQPLHATQRNGSHRVLRLTPAGQRELLPRLTLHAVQQTADADGF